MKRRALAALLCLCLTLTLLPLSAGAAEMGHSGLLSMKKLTREEIRALLADNPLGVSGDPMAEKASLSAPYTTGRVRDAALAAGLGRLNALRRIAGLGQVALDDALTERAQYGAVVLAAAGEASHHPSQPADMDAAFYQRGHSAASSSNVYMGSGATLPQAVEAFFEDTGVDNLTTVGHRRWMLNPTMALTGLGFTPGTKTYGSLTYNFAACWAFDRSGTGGDYDFIAWPASGNFPTSLFSPAGVWSVTLDPEKYAAPSMDTLGVTVIRESDGRTWIIQGAHSPSESGEYLGVDTSNYAIANCIIFRPDTGGTPYEGTYTVTLTGLKTVGGEGVNLSYQVDFFDLDGSTGEPEPAAGQPGSDIPEDAPPEMPEPSQPDPGASQTPANPTLETLDLDRRVLELEVGDTVKLVPTIAPGGTGAEVNWTSDSPEIVSVRGGVLTAKAVGKAVIMASAGKAFDLCMVTVKKAGTPVVSVFSDVSMDAWYGMAVMYATSRGLFNGVGNGRFDPEGGMSRAMVMTVLARLDGVDTTPQSSLEDWAIRGMRWAVTNRISDGLNPDNLISLEELATMLYRYALLRGAAQPSMVDVLSGRSDGGDVSLWAVEGMNWAVSKGVIIGDTEGKLYPRRTATRAQVAIILQRYLDKVSFS